MNSTFPASSGECEREDDRDEDLYRKKVNSLTLEGLLSHNFSFIRPSSLGRSMKKGRDEEFSNEKKTSCSVGHATFKLTGHN